MEQTVWFNESNRTFNIEYFPLYGHHIIAACLAVIIILGVCLNACVIAVIVRVKSARLPMSLLLVNVCAGDLAVSIMGTPLAFVASLYGRWMWSRELCVWYGFTHFTCGVNSITTLTVVAYERYMVMLKKQRMSMKNVIFCILFSWLYSLIWSVPPLFGWSHYEQEGPGTSCSIAWKSRDIASTTYIFIIIFTCFAGPLMCIIFSYFNVVRAVREGVKSQMLGTRRLAKVEGRVCKILMVMVLGFVMAWTPYAIVVLLSRFKPELVTPGLAIIPSIFAKSCTVYNPIIYFIMNEQFRRSGVELFCCQKPSMTNGRTLVPVTYNASIELAETDVYGKTTDTEKAGVLNHVPTNSSENIQNEQN